MIEGYLQTHILAQVLGLYMVIMAIILLVRINDFKQMLSKMDANSPTVMIASAYGLLFGIFLVTIHNVWGSLGVNILSIICWFVVIKSLLWLSFPKQMIQCAKKLYGGNGYYIMVLACAFFGIVLMALGYHYWFDFDLIK